MIELSVLGFGKHSLGNTAVCVREIKRPFYENVAQRNNVHLNKAISTSSLGLFLEYLNYFQFIPTFLR